MILAAPVPPLEYFHDLSRAVARARELRADGWSRADVRHSLLLHTPTYVVDPEGNAQRYEGVSLDDVSDGM